MQEVAENIRNNAYLYKYKIDQIYNSQNHQERNYHRLKALKILDDTKDYVYEIIYYKNLNDSSKIDLRGCTMEFVSIYLNDIIVKKMDYNLQVFLIVDNNERCISFLKNFLSEEDIKFSNIDNKFILFLFDFV